MEMNHLQHKQKLEYSLICVVLAIVLVATSFQYSYADNEIKLLLKIRGSYPADSAFFDAVIDPPLTNMSKAFAWVTFSHTGEADHSDTFASWEIVDNSTLRIKGENTATGNIAKEFMAYIVVFTDDSTVNVQQLTGTINSGGTGTETFTIPTSINITNSMIISQGHHHNATETSIGAEEMDRIRIVDPTTWEYLVQTAPNSGPQGNTVSVIDWGSNDISVQRGLTTLSDASASITVSPPTDIDRSRSILMFTYATGTATSEEPNDYMVRGQIDASVPPDLSFERSGTEDDVLISWEVIEFPVDMVKVHHDEVSLADGDLSATDFIPFVTDFDKTVVIAQSGTPFGFGTAEMSSATTGANDRGQFDIQLLNNTQVGVTRGDSTGTADLYYQVIEFLEPNFPQNDDGQNKLKRIVQIKDEFLGTTATQEYTISPPLDSLDKHMIFLTYRDDALGTADTADRFFTWRVTDLDTLTILGSNDPVMTNGMNFTATIIEFDSTSPIFTQYDELQFAEGINTDEKIMHMSPVNASSSFLVYQGWTSTSGDTTIGQEEIPAIRLINGSQWGYDLELPSNDQESALNVQIIDLNSNKTSVQNGAATITGTSLGVSPPVDIIKNQTLLFVTISTTGGEFEVPPSEAGILATIDDSSPPDIIFERIDGTAPAINLQWSLIQIPSDQAFIQHGRHNQTAGVGNGTETITSINSTEAFAIGTVFAPNGHGNGKSTFTTDDSFGEAFGQITLEDDTTVRFERDLTTSSWEVGYQVYQLIGGLQLTETLVEVIGVAAATSIDTTKIETETITITEVVTPSIGTNQLLAGDAMVIVDVLIEDTSKTETESLSIIDTVTPSLGIIQLLNGGLNNLTITETISKDSTKVIPDSISILDILTSNSTEFETLPDAISILDLLTVSSGIQQSLPGTQNNMTIIDNLVINTNTGLGAGDVVILVDLLNSETFKTFSDSAAILDSLAISSDTFITLPETIPFSESPLTIAQVFIENVTDTITINVVVAPNVPVNATGPTSGGACGAGSCPGAGGGSGGVPISPRPFGFDTLQFDVEDTLISLEPGETISSDLFVSWNTDDDLRIVQIVPSTNNEFFSFEGTPIDLDSTGITSSGSIDYNLRLPSSFCPTGPMPGFLCIDRFQYQIPVTVEAFVDGRTVVDSGIITINVERGLEIPSTFVLLAFVAAGAAFFIIALVAKSRRKVTPHVRPRDKGTLKDRLEKRKKVLRNEGNRARRTDVGKKRR